LFRKPPKVIKDADFIFENSTVKVVANRNCPEIDLLGLKIGPFEEGKEYEVRFWIACELEKSGIARLRKEELLDAAQLYRVQWLESTQPAKKLSQLANSFYSKLRIHLNDLKKEAISSPEKMKEYEKAMNNARDIVDCRLRKIISLASTSRQTSQILENLTREERFLYEHIFELIRAWRQAILKTGEE
jgi:hypothetical protein